MTLLYKQFMLLSAKQILIVFGSVVGIIGGFHTFMHLVSYRNLSREIDGNYHLIVFIFSFFAGCLLWCGHAFPGFRSKEKSMDYLMLPASSIEKFFFEFINRFIIYLISFPMVYWAITNLVTSIFHAYNPEYQNYIFEFDILIPKLIDREITLAVCLAMFMFTIPFTGATYFKKMPLLKTIIIVFLLVGIYFGIGYLLVEGFNLEEYRPRNKLLFMKDEEDAKLAGIWAALIAHATLLIISYFKLKEKEV